MDGVRARVHIGVIPFWRDAMVRLLTFLAALLIAAPSAHAEREQVADLIVMDSAYAPAETAARFKAAIEEKGIAVVATVDHAAAAARADLDLPPTVMVIFGNPKVGTPLMQMAPTIAADLPLRALFWMEDGVSRAAVLDPKALAERHGIPVEHKRIEGLEGALTNFLSAAAR